MSLNIKNPRVHELAREAAQRFGMSQTSVIKEALVRLLGSQERQVASTEADVFRLLADFEEQLSPKERLASVRHDNLYDEHGLRRACPASRACGPGASHGQGGVRG